ncbi:(Fe-S)-binding protein [Desulfovibrio legallii]|jgi:glycolate oxidase iron-sulfur subunit|uniref:Glycolate oxidase iron-sulfur subunit n=1 Tax=Desulfovibrio legallii TaxID=571438 RepID=A0A1G7HU63_9BACT|nr:(Fe-S)-binding protein [Desulfovibrio legallii]SDF03878.1 glycolate oxidase iron-sulfur subunit [Desulfovibrio legallii]
MSTLHELAQRLMALDDKITACMKCGMCQAVCPMFGASGMEADVARGKLALIDNLAHEMLKDPAAVGDKLGRCLLCGSCQAACPPGVQIMDVFMDAREIVNEYLGLHPAKKMIFRTLLTKPGLFNFAMRVGAPMQGLMFRRTGDTQGTVCAPMLNFMLGDRHMRPLAKTPLHARYGALDEPRRSGGLKVAFFPGCMGDKMYTEMSEACLKVLRHHNVAVFMPKGMTCCGIPALSSGDVKGMAEQMKVNAAALAKGDFDYLLSPCASCTSTIKELWPRYANRLGSVAQRKVEELAAKTMDINAFLVDVLQVHPAEHPQGNAVAVTYHDSCHLKKSLGVAAQPRTVIAANPAYELKEMAEADRCCGCGGSFNLFHYDYSRQIGQRKRDNVVASGAQVVAAGCPACMMQLEDVLSHNHDNVRVKHTVEIYAESLK